MNTTRRRNPSSFWTDAATSCGLSLVGLIQRQSVENTLAVEAARLAAWQDQGYAGEMGYMQRKSSLYASLDAVLPDFQSVIIVARSYPRNDFITMPLPSGCGRVASYAWGQDYHLALKSQLSALAGKITERIGRPMRYRCFVDAAPILERALARVGGLGALGKNGLLLRSGLGSHIFIGEIVTDLVLSDEELVKPGIDNKEPCRHCSRCLDSCPTGALVKDYVLDARKCRSYLTIEKKGVFLPREANSIGEWVFGCDVCQACCPYNKGIQVESVGANAAAAFVRLADILAIRDDQQFSLRYQDTAWLRAGRAQILRNACAVAANSKCLAVSELLISCFKEDPSEIVRQQAKQALEILQSDAAGLDATRIKAALS